MPALAGPVLLLEDGTTGVSLDHLVVDGARAERQAYTAGCERPATFGPAVVANGVKNFRVRRSVMRQALCSTGLGVSGEAVIEENAIVENGVHNRAGLWADGMTLVLKDSWVVGNIVRDNTDVDMIFGECLDCDVQDNRIGHSDLSDWFQRSSFASLMIHGWPETSGRYDGSDFSGNSIDCGRSRGCGYGLLLGAAPWYSAKLSGGTFHHNTVANAQQGIAIADATGPIVVYANAVSNSGNYRRATCQGREHERVRTTAYSVSPRSSRYVDVSRERHDVSHEEIDFAGCLLNSWRQPSCEALGGISHAAPCSQQELGIAYDADYCCPR